MSWMHTQNLYAWIFNTGRGLAICLRFPNNLGVIYDLGCSCDFSPTTFIIKHIAPYLKGYGGKKIAQGIMSHPHVDHISEVGHFIAHKQIKKPLVPYLITCPNDRSAGEKLDYSRIENEDNQELIEKYKKSYAGRNPPLQTLVHGKEAQGCNDFEYGIYYMRPPEVAKIHEGNAHHYGNGVSLCMYIRYGANSMLIPGDITPEAISEVLDDSKSVEKRLTLFHGNDPASASDWHTATSSQPGLSDMLDEYGLSVLVAPHHGLESCYSEKLFDAIQGGKPVINIISDMRKKSETSGSVHPRYHSKDGAFGLSVDIEGKTEYRYGVSTKNDHHILIVMRPEAKKPHIYLRADPSDLLNIE